MRITLITLQLCVLGLLYLVVAMPLLAAATGLAYILVTETQAVLATSMGLGIEAAGYFTLQAVGALPYTAQAPVIVTAASSLSGAASVFVSLTLPLLITLLVNLLFGFFAYYRDWYKRARRWAIACNIVCLCGYAAFQALVMHFALEEAGKPSQDGAGFKVFVLVLGLIMLIWDGYFIASIVLLLRMPKRADLAKTVGRMPAMHLSVWALLVLGWILVLALIGFPFHAATVVVSVLLLLSALPFVFNARAVGRMVETRKKRFVVPVLLANTLLTLFCLVFLPPVGVGLLLSTAWLFLLAEMIFRRGNAAPNSPSPSPVGE